MQNFNYYAPTQVVFGRETENEVADMADKCTTGDNITIGGLMILKKADIIKIYEMANK